VRCIIHRQGHPDVEFFANHTFSAEQVKWFKAGSALNLVRERVKKATKK